MTYNEVRDALWNAQIDGLIDRYEGAAAIIDGVQVPGAIWRIIYRDGTDSGEMTLAQTSDALEALYAETGGPDPVTEVELQNAIDAGLIDCYEHCNVRGEPRYRLHAIRDGEPWALTGTVEQVRAALWGARLGQLVL